MMSVAGDILKMLDGNGGGESSKGALGYIIANEVFVGGEVV